MNNGILAFWMRYHNTNDRLQECRNLNGSYKFQAKIVFIPDHRNVKFTSDRLPASSELVANQTHYVNNTFGKGCDEA